MQKLRPYQTRAVELTREAFGGGALRVLLVLPTGAGKTVVFSHCARAHLAKGGRQVLVIVHRVELVRQAAEKLRAEGLRVGTIVAGVATDADAPAVVGLIDSLREADLNPSMVVVDEAHHAAAATWRTLLRRLPTVPVLGVTATPSRLDGKSLGGIFEALVVGATVAELQALGHLVPAVVLASRGGLADALDAIRRYAEGRRHIVVYAASVTAARELATELGGEVVYGAMAPEARVAALERFARGETRILTNCSVLTEGWDAPAIDCVVVARGCSSPALWLQMIGRGLRPSEGKKDCLVLDLKASVRKHGLPEDAREYSLAGRPIEVTEDKDSLRQCKVCGWVGRGRIAVCPRCFTAFPPRKREKAKKQELIRVRHVESEDVRREFYREQCRVAKEKGYKPGWVLYKFKSRFGYFPEKRMRL